MTANITVLGDVLLFSCFDVEALIYRLCYEGSVLIALMSVLGTLIFPSVFSFVLFSRSLLPALVHARVLELSQLGKASAPSRCQECRFVT